VQEVAIRRVRTNQNKWGKRRLLKILTATFRAFFPQTPIGTVACASSSHYGVVYFGVVLEAVALLLAAPQNGENRTFFDDASLHSVNCTEHCEQRQCTADPSLTAFVWHVCVVIGALAA
jgi:hypothetical protein